MASNPLPGPALAAVRRHDGSCPRCAGPTIARRRALVGFVDSPSSLPPVAVVTLPCGYCRACDMIVAEEPRVRELLESRHPGRVDGPMEFLGSIDPEGAAPGRLTLSRLFAATVEFREIHRPQVRVLRARRRAAGS